MKTTKNWLVAIVCALGLGLAACSGAVEQEPSPEAAQEPSQASQDHVDDRNSDPVDGRTGTSAAPLITRTRCEDGGGRVVCGWGCLYLKCTGGNPDNEGLVTYAN